MTTLREAAQMALNALELVDGYVMGKHEAKEALYEALAQPEQEPVGNTITFMTRAIFNVVASHQEINGGYFIADGDVAAFVDRLAKVINSTFEPLKHKNPAPPQQPEQEPVAWMDAHDPTDLYYRKPLHPDAIPLYTAKPQREWQSLTDEEIERLFVWQEWSEDFADYEPVARAIEAKLREKNS